MLRYLDDPPRAWGGERLPPNGTALPGNAEAVMSDDELNAFGLGREVVVKPQPSATQVLEGPTYERTNKTVTATWTVRDMTQEELDALREGAIPPVDDIQLQIALDHENRLLALEGQPPVTGARYREKLKQRIGGRA